jgi:hypothetical protein
MRASEMILRTNIKEEYFYDFVLYFVLHYISQVILRISDTSCIIKCEVNVWL